MIIKKFRILSVFILIFMAFIPIINQNIIDYTQVQAKDAIGDNYYNAEKSTSWENPSMIKVYIEGNSDKSYLAKRAFNAWNNGTGIFNFYFVNDKTKADITVTFIHKLGASVAGLTHHDWVRRIKDKNGKIKKFFYKQVEITIAYSNDAVGRFTGDHNYFYKVILHEIGHALGITGYHSDNPNDIMYPSVDGMNNSGALSSRDINTMKKIYNQT